MDSRNRAESTSRSFGIQPTDAGHAMSSLASAGQRKTVLGARRDALAHNQGAVHTSCVVFRNVAEHLVGSCPKLECGPAESAGIDPFASAVPAWVGVLAEAAGLVHTPIALDRSMADSLTGGSGREPPHPVSTRPLGPPLSTRPSALGVDQSSWSKQVATGGELVRVDFPSGESLLKEVHCLAAALCDWIRSRPSANQTDDCFLIR
jgi:hypothetical protein